MKSELVQGLGPGHDNQIIAAIRGGDGVEVVTEEDDYLVADAAQAAILDLLGWDAEEERRRTGAQV